jgi:GNAT superfamily N-acetyltransferase
MQFQYLTDRPDAARRVARWYFEEWGYLHKEGSLEKTLEGVRRYLNRGVMPYILLATDGDAVMGAAQLKYREMAETFPDYEHWLGGVYVVPEYRDRAVGSALADEIARRAPSCGVDTLYLQTERLDGGLYRKLGWKPITRVKVRGPEVLVMRRSVGQPDGRRS